MHPAGRLRSTLTAVAASVVTGAVLLVAPVAPGSATPTARDDDGRTGCVAPRCFGAISFNTRTGVAGVTNEKDGRPKAIRLAQRSCRHKSELGYGYPGQCTPAGSVQNGCMAVAFRVLDDAIVEWQPAFGHTKREAKSAARRSVAGEGDRYVAGWLCTTRHYD